MLQLRRVVRFCVNPIPDTEPQLSHNSFAAYPSMRGLGRFYELDVTCLGRVDPVTGYFVNIKVIDNAVRSVAVPVIALACSQSPHEQPCVVLSRVLGPLNEALHHSVLRVGWRLTPYYSVEMSPKSPDRALLRQQFDFAASHRLNCSGKSVAENTALFGKCNNPRGHGHNYRVEPCVEVPVATGPRPFDLADLERITAEAIVDRFDHKHLNDDTPEFAEPTGLNPSVENIAKVCFDLLAPRIQREGRGATLRNITVWETDKTSCTYPA